VGQGEAGQTFLHFGRDETRQGEAGQTFLHLGRDETRQGVDGGPKKVIRYR